MSEQKSEPSPDIAPVERKDVLARIETYKRREIAEAKLRVPQTKLEKRVANATPPRGFADWFEKFLPQLAHGEPATLFAPVTVSDRSDGKIAHLDGLNFSRSWCWSAIAPQLEPRTADRARTSALRHFDAALPHVASDYAGEHWLATFALLAAQEWNRTSGA